MTGSIRICTKNRGKENIFSESWIVSSTINEKHRRLNLKKKTFLESGFKTDIATGNFVSNNTINAIIIIGATNSNLEY
jgi:hypothetical protein